MNTIADFMKQISDYYGAFQNKTVQNLFAQHLSQIKPSDYDRTFDYILAHNPATWHPDVKALTDAVKALDLVTVTRASRETCPVCGNVGTFRGGVCVNCKYDINNDGDPKKYKDWWISYQNGNEPVFNISDLCKIGHYEKSEYELKSCGTEH